MQTGLIRPAPSERPDVLAAGQRPERPARARREAELWPLPGLCWNARVTTSFGELPVQALRVRDPVRTASGNYVPVRWVDQIHLDEAFLAECPDALPVVIPAHCFGPGRPAQALAVSPSQKLNAATTDFGTDLRPARELLDRPGVTRKPETGMTYYLFHCGAPEMVRIEGLFVPTAP